MDKKYIYVFGTITFWKHSGLATWIDLIAIFMPPRRIISLDLQK